jgi:hypothetical protein
LTLTKHTKKQLGRVCGNLCNAKYNDFDTKECDKMKTFNMFNNLCENKT